MTRITFHEGDNRDSLRRLIDAGVRVHSVVCDPPYGLTSVTKRFGKEGAAPAKFGTDGAFSRASAGFMGSKWDGTGIERDPDFWALIHEILLPGGFCIAFSSPRTGHWQACAMELAGFVMHPFFGWAYGQGFPKAHNAAKAIDKALGKPCHTAAVGEPVRRMIPGSPAGEKWSGWAYGTQTAKPALEPIYVGQKPFSEKSGAFNLLKHGVGAMNIDACRVAATGESAGREGEEAADRCYRDRGSTNFTGVPGSRGGSPQGRHPANLLHDGSEAVLACFPDAPGQFAAAAADPTIRTTQNVYGSMHRSSGSPTPRGDSGSAARFFNVFPLGPDEYAAEPITQPFLYNPKANKADRAGSAHPTVKPIALMRWLVRLVTPPGGVVLDPFAGSGTTAQAARDEGFDCVLMEASRQFADDIRRRFKITSSSEFDPEIEAMLGPETGSQDVAVERTRLGRVAGDIQLWRQLEQDSNVAKLIGAFNDGVDMIG